METTYEAIYIQDNPCLIGYNIPFQQKECFGLRVGEQVKKIGQFTSSSSYEANFVPYTTYCGQIEIEECLYAAFLVPENGVRGFREGARKPVYILLIIGEEEAILYKPKDKRRVVYPVYPVFVLENNELRIYKELLSPTGSTKHKKMINRIVNLATKENEKKKRKAVKSD